MKYPTALAAVLGICSLASVRADLTNGLIAYFNFDQAVSQTIPDQSGFGRDATLYYAWNQGPGEAGNRAAWAWTAPGNLTPYFDATGKWGMGLALQGTTFQPKLAMVAKMGADFDGASAQRVTISYWAKRESYRNAGWGSKGVTTVRTKGDRTNKDPLSVDWGDWSDTVDNIDYDTMQPRYGGGNFEVRMFGNASQRNFSVGGVLSGNGIGGTIGQGDNTWHHFLWEYAPDNSVTLTVDGTLVSTQAGNGWNVLPFDSIVIGEAWDTGGDINDSLDDVAIWNRALTPEEKSYLLTHPVIPAPEPPPFGTRNYAWNGSSNSLPAIYLGGDNDYPNAGGTYAMVNGQLKVSSPGGNGWIGNQFDWVGPLANNETVSGSVTFRINAYSNGPDADSLGRVRLFWFNAPFANGLNAFASLYGSDKWMTRSQGWKPDIQNQTATSEWGKWEFNPDTAGAHAPEGMVYVYNSFNISDPATNTDFYRPVAKGTDHVFSWTARYLPSCGAVQVDTALDGVYWTTMFIDRKFNNLGWLENALAKQHGSMQGAWEAEFTQVNWATTTATASSDTKNYWWSGRQNVGENQQEKFFPPFYVGGTNNYAEPDGWYGVWNDSPVLWVGMDPASGWRNNAFDWTGPLAVNEKLSGSMTFFVEYFTNGLAADSLGRVRLLWVNGVYANGLNAFASLYASDKKTSHSDGWRPGGHSEWNKWEYNPNTAGAFAPDGQVYIYNSFNMSDPVSDPNFFKAIDKESPHTFSWSAQYIPALDVVRVITKLDGDLWTNTDLNRGFNNLGWGENALAKQHGSMQDGAWSAAIGVLTWNSSPADPTLTVSKLPNGNIQLTWPFGTLLEATSVIGPWLPITATSPHTITPSGQNYYRVLVHQ
jgi:hypothetical protein